MWWAWVFLFACKGGSERGLRQKTRSFAILVLTLFLLCGCRGNPLPVGMDEETLQKHGREAAVLLASGDYEEVLGRMREDVAAGVTVEEIQKLVIQQTGGAGVYKEIDSAMATGQSSDGETYGVAVIYCKYSKKNVLFRLAFDTDYGLIGLEVRKP